MSPSLINCSKLLKKLTIHWDSLIKQKLLHEVVLKKEADLKKLFKRITNNLNPKKVNNNKIVKAQTKITIKMHQISYEPNPQQKIVKLEPKEINNWPDYQSQADFHKDKNLIQSNNTLIINKNLKLHNKQNNLF